MKNTPKLRFPEFLDDGEWEEKKLGNVGKVSMCKRIMKDETTETGEIPFYKIGTFGKKADAYIDKELYEEYKEKYSFPKKGDILISASGTIGRLVVYDGIPAYFQDSNIVWIDNNEEIVINSFLFFFYETVKWTTSDSTIARLYNDNLRSVQILKPSPPEQQKIADCLSSVDNLITAGSKKVETLKEHKKALMQQLFPQDGEEVPKLRFPEFKNAPKWEEKTLNKACEINPSSKNLPKRFVYIDLESVESGILLQRKIIDLDNAPSRAQRLLQKEDIIFQMVRPYQKNNYFFNIDDDYNYVASTGYAQLRAYQSTKYLYHFLHSDGFVINVLAKCTGSNYPAINSNDLSEITISIPKPDEQQKIANFLSSIDELITSSTKKVETLKEHKKALMQQLFPNNKDITNE